MQRSTFGVGPALRKARQARGVSIAEASRDTRIRPEFIQALEAEDFGRLLGDVYVRGALRSYAGYLGLPADRVLSRYARVAGEITAASPGPPPASDAVVGAPRRRDSHRLVAMSAATLVIVAAAFGILSTRTSAPSPARAVAGGSFVETVGPGISLAVSTQDEPVEATVRTDSGEPLTFTLLPGESRAFVADVSITIRLSKGATANVVVSGRDLGTPGSSSHPWKRTFSYSAASSPPPPGA
ncbi:MAG TPA: helix-turn-helix transcriptional regulator [Actinomycetota bacterium]